MFEMLKMYCYSISADDICDLSKKEQVRFVQKKSGEVGEGGACLHA